MLTNEEALRLIKECEKCFVVWATDQNAIVAVHPIPIEADPLKALTMDIEALAAMKTSAFDVKNYNRYRSQITMR